MRRGSGLCRKFPGLQTPRLELRELTVADAPWYLVHFSEPEIVRGTGFPAQEGIDGALDEMDRYVTGLFDRREGIRWGLVLAETRNLVDGGDLPLDWRRDALRGDRL